MESGETLAVVQRSYATTSPAFVGIHNGLYFDVALDGSSERFDVSLETIYKYLFRY